MPSYCSRFIPNYLIHALKGFILEDKALPLQPVYILSFLELELVILPLYIPGHSSLNVNLNYFIISKTINFMHAKYYNKNSKTIFSIWEPPIIAVSATTTTIL